MADFSINPHSEMQQRVDAFDWASTPLGPMDRWPQSLRTAVGLLLNSRFPMFVWWGPQYINIYNDAYAPMLGKRHPEALGKPAQGTWSDIWDVVGKQADFVCRTGQATWNDRVKLVMERHGYWEDTWFTWSYSPVIDESGKVGGMFCAVVEETPRVRAERDLLESQRRFQALATAGAQVLYRMNADWSEMQALDGQGFLVNTVAPRNDWMNQYILADDQPRVREAIGAAVEGKSIFELEHRVRRADGSIGWMQSRAVPLLDSDGRLTEWIGTATDVTERRRNENVVRDLGDRLARQSRLFEQIAATTPDFIYVFDLQWRFLYANQRLLQVWGKTYEEAVGKNMAELGYPAWHVEMHHRELEQVVRTKRPIKGSVPFTGGSGISGVYEYIFTPVLGPDGEVEVIAGTTRDVTDREQLLAALKAERANLASIIEQAPVFIATLRGPDHVFELANHRYLDIVGHRDIIGKPVREALPEIISQGFLEVLDQVYRSGEPFSATERPVLLRGRGGAIDQRFLNFTYQPLRDAGGAVSAIFVHGFDVTEHVRTREARAESEQRLRLTADAIPALIAYVDSQQVYRFANAAYLQWFGEGPEAIVGRALRDVAGDAVYDDRLPMIRRALAGETVTFEFPMPHQSRGQRDTETSYVPDHAPDGTVRGFVVLVYDITARKEAERDGERLLDAERFARGEAERASRMKDEFLATLSHELRTPLNAIFGWSQILARGDRSPDEVKHGLRIIDRNARAQTQIIEDLLEMSRIISGMVRLNIQSTDVSAVLQAAVETVRPAADAKGVWLGTDMESAAVPISGDPGRLQQVFWNLLSNAVKFTPAGGQVRVSMARQDAYLEVSVVDTGEGIRPEFLPHVFDRFRQADASTTRRHGGLGLGLAIVKQLVELHGGSVRVRSDGLGRGSTFSVLLPVTPVVALAEQEPGDRRSQAAASPPPALPLATIDGVSVVLVEDESDARAMIHRLLEDAGAAVRSAESAADAMRLMNESVPDVLVSDIGMPGEDGYSLIKRVRQLAPDSGGRVQAIALTAYARVEDRVRTFNAGFQSHVVKPVDPGELIAVIAALTGRASPGAVHSPV